jgi:hypothetical protein
MTLYGRVIPLVLRFCKSASGSERENKIDAAPTDAAAAAAAQLKKKTSVRVAGSFCYNYSGLACCGICASYIVLHKNVSIAFFRDTFVYGRFST